MNKVLSKNIKNIIFDLGGVILNIDPSLTIQEFKRLGMENFDEMYTLLKQSRLFDDLEIGKISARQFREGLRTVTSLNMADHDIDYAWNAMILDIPGERLKILKELKEKYRTFLFSNTNEIHLKKYNGVLKNVHGVENMGHYFEKAYYSHLIGSRKPDAESFRFIMNDAGLKPQETLFIDDLEANIIGAGNAGLKTFHLKSPITIRDVFTT